MAENTTGAAPAASPESSTTSTPVSNTDASTSPSSNIQNPIAELANAKKYKVKIDGQEAEVDEQELINNYQIRKASDKRFQEGMQARKQAEEFVKLLKTDPVKVLTHPTIGADFKKLAEDYLLKEIEQQMMTPEQRKMQEYQQKLAAYEEQEKIAKQQQEAAQKQAIQQKYQDEYNKQIVGALETSGLPKTEFTVQRMVYYMYKALEAGYNVTANDVTDLVRRDYINDTKALYSGLDEEALFKILGDDVANKIRKADLRKFKSNTGPVKVNSPGAGLSKSIKPEKITKDMWRKKLEEIED